MRLLSDFKSSAEDRAAFARKMQDIQLDQFMADEALSGKDVKNIGRLLVSSAAAAFQNMAALAEKEAQDATDDFLFVTLLAQIQQQIAEAERQLAEIRRNLATVTAELVQEFGRDFILKNAEMYLSPEIFARKAGETDVAHEDRMKQEMEALMLDEDGNTKDEYKGLNIAEFLMLKRQEREVAKELDNMKDEHANLVAKVHSGEATRQDFSSFQSKVGNKSVKAQSRAVSQLSSSFVEEAVGASLLADGKTELIAEVEEKLLFDDAGLGAPING